MGIADGGQVLVSQATEQVATDVELRDLGEHGLRDLSRRERVFQLVVAGLPTDFPPLRSLDTYAGNLPLQLTSFVGREREVDMVAIALRESRLVTIIGVGGVGKTRLAVQVAAEIISEYRDGVWICELGAAADPEAVAQIVGSALGVTARRDVALDESIVEHLRGKQLLVVLDNCEHVLDTAGDLVDAVLRSCRDVCVLGDES